MHALSANGPASTDKVPPGSAEVLVLEFWLLAMIEAQLSSRATLLTSSY